MKGLLAGRNLREITSILIYVYAYMVTFTIE